jgi:glycosyltransferase involved in cell wall biosynthesis
VPVPVSVIMIFKDEERFLEEAVESVFQQAFDGWELLLVDDGSTDASGGIAQRHVGRRPGHVRYLRHPGGANLGTGASRNLGLRHGRGRFVAFLDADDVWLPSKLEEQVALMRQRPDVGLVYGPVELWHSWTGAPGSRPDEFMELGVPTETVIPPPRLLPQLIENRYQTPTTSGSLLRRDVVERVGGVDSTFRGMYEDQTLFAKVLSVSPTYVSGRCWTRYRQREDSLSAHFDATVPYARGRLPYLLWAQDYLLAAGIGDGEVWSALRRELRAARHPRLTELGGRARRALPGRLRGRRS